MNPKISIALATYNGGCYLQEQLDSFLAQSKMPDELVACDDHSTDETIAILEKFAQTSPFKVHIYKNTSNLGVTKNFEKAIFNCTGDLIFLSDQDDIWLPEKIKTLSEIFINTPHTGVAFCNAHMCNENMKPLGYDIWKALWFTDERQYKVHFGKAFEVFLQFPMIAGMTMAFQADFRKILLPFPNIHSCHDVWVLILIAAISDVKMTDKQLVSHRVHGKNLSGITLKNLYQQFLKAKDQIKDNRFKYDLDLHEAIFKRISEIKGLTNINSRVIENLQGKIDHLQKRTTMPENKLKRISLILKELSHQRYQRYSYGYKSALQDLILR